MTTRRWTMPSPLGPLTLVANDAGLTHVWFAAPGDVLPSHIVCVQTISHPTDHALLERAARELDEYFAGTRTAFTLPLAATGTPFQASVWRALVAIPYGERRSYRDIAEALGRPSATRAVGAANGRNPLGIVVPCHRVVGADGTLTGYAGGLEAKRWLLTHERRHLGFALVPSAP